MPNSAIRDAIALLQQECADRSIQNIEELLAISGQTNSLKLARIRSMVKAHAEQEKALDNLARFLVQW